MRVSDRWNDDEVTVAVHGDIDFVSVGNFTDRMAEVIRRNPRRLVIDMAGVEFVDSAGLHAFVRIRGTVPEGCRVLLRSARPRIRQVFAITGLDTAFDFGLPPSANHSAACKRTFSRLARPAADRPPPSGHLIPPQ